MQYIIGSRNGANFSFSNSPCIHETLQSAEQERDRLARSTPGKTFVVCQLISEAVVNSLVVTRHDQYDENKYNFLFSDVRRLCAQNKKVEAIKYFRERTGAGLHDAKWACEMIAQGYSNMDKYRVAPNIVEIALQSSL